MDTFNSLCSSYDYHRLINQGAKIACPCFWTLLFCPPLPSCLCATAFITFDLFPVFAATAEMEMVKLIALLEGGGRRFPWEFANFAAIAKMLPQYRLVAAHSSGCVQFVSRAAKSRQIFQCPNSSQSNLARYEVHYQLVDLAFQLGHACPCKKCANKEGRPATIVVHTTDDPLLKVVLEKTHYEWAKRSWPTHKSPSSCSMTCPQHVF